MIGIKSLIPIPVILCLFTARVFSQGTNNPEAVSVEAMQKKFEEALQKAQAEGQKESQALTAELTRQLNSAIEDWLAQEKKKREQELDKRIKQDWEKSIRFGSPLAYEYDLRDYAYGEREIDIIQTRVLTMPYKGFLRIREKLYLEKAHPEAISRRTAFLYTATRLIEVNFDYLNQKFIAVNTAYGKITLQQGWPEEIIIRFRQRITQGMVR